MELLGGEPGHQEVAIVHQRVAHAGVRQVGGELGLPDPLGEPEARRIHAEARADRLVQPLDLLDPVLARERRQHRLVEAGEQELDPAVGGEPAEPVEVGGLVELEPLEQRSAQVQHDRQELPVGERVEQRAVHVLDVLGEDVIEVADGLMEVQAEREADGSHGLAEDEGARAAERRGDGGHHVGEERVPLGELRRAAVAALERVGAAVEPAPRPAPRCRCSARGTGARRSPPPRRSR